MNVPKNVVWFEVFLYMSLTLDALSVAFQDRTPSAEMTEQMITVATVMAAFLILLLVYFVWLAAQRRKNWPRFALAGLLPVFVISVLEVIGNNGVAPDRGSVLVCLGHCRCPCALFFGGCFGNEIRHAAKITDDRRDIACPRRHRVALVAEQCDDDPAALALLAQPANRVLNHRVRWFSDVADAEGRGLRKVERKESRHRQCVGRFGRAADSPPCQHLRQDEGCGFVKLAGAGNAKYGPRSCPSFR